MNDFRSFMLSTEVPLSSRVFPVKEEEFMFWMEYWVENTGGGQFHFTNNRVGLIEGELKFMQVRAVSTGRSNFSYGERKKLYQIWEALKDEYEADIANAGATKAIGPVHQVAGKFWPYLASEKALLQGSYQGIFLAIIFALLVIFIATLNIYQSLLSIFCVIAIVSSIVAIIVLQGWTLGMSENAGILIIIGLSVDYIVHLS